MIKYVDVVITTDKTTNHDIFLGMEGEHGKPVWSEAIKEGNNLRLRTWLLDVTTKLQNENLELTLENSALKMEICNLHKALYNASKILKANESVDHDRFLSNWEEQRSDCCKHTY